MSPTDNVWVLYEDSLADGAKRYGFHQLVLACVADDVAHASACRPEVWDLSKPILGLPKNGNAKVVGECRRNFEKLAKRSGAVVAVLDSDRVCECANVESGSCKQTILKALRDQIFETRPHAPGLEIVLLERNAESVIEAIRSVAPELVGNAVFEGALGKDRTDRDRVFQAAAFGEPGQRRTLRDRHTSFDRLIVRIHKRYGQLT